MNKTSPGCCGNQIAFEISSSHGNVQDLYVAVSQSTVSVVLPHTLDGFLVKISMSFGGKKNVV